MAKRIVVAITGASGAVYAKRLIECLADGQAEIHLVISPHGRRLLAEEISVSEPIAKQIVEPSHQDAVTIHPYRDIGSQIASGSFLTDGMIICPCSSNTLGAVASGLGSNLITRAAAVHLKEGRKLVLVPREMPISIIELENMLRIAKAGGMICPASPGYYMQPKRIDDLVDFVVGKLCDLLCIPHQLETRWKPDGMRREECTDL